MQQAGAGAVGEHRVRTGAEQEDALHGGDGLVDRPGGGEGAVIAAFADAGAAMLGDLRVGVVFGEHQPGVGFVVAQHDVEARLEAFDEVGFEEEGLGLGVGGDDLHGGGFGDHAAEALGQAADLGVGDDALFQRAGLADIEGVALGIEHAVDAGGERHGFQRGFDDADALWRGWDFRGGVGHAASFRRLPAGCSSGVEGGWIPSTKTVDKFVGKAWRSGATARIPCLPADCPKSRQ